MPVSSSSFRWARALQPASHAYLQVRLIGPAGASAVHVSLLDSGATHSVFGQLVARQAGYSLGGLAIMTVALANGAAASMHVLSNATLEVEGHTVRVPQILIRAGNGTDLVCPDDFLAASEFAFDPQNLYFD